MKKKLNKWLSIVRNLDLSRLSLSTKLKIYDHSRLFILGFILAGFIFVNAVFAVLPLRVDLSSGSAYTLSKSTQEIINKIDGTVKIKIFLSSDLPIRLFPLRSDIISLAGEYDRQGGRRIEVTILDPKKDSQAKKEAQDFGIPELQFSQIEKDKYALSSAYIGIALLYKDKMETISQAVNPSSLEYDLTSAIYKLTSKEPIRIGLIGFGTLTQENAFSSLRQLLQQQYLVDEVNLASGEAQEQIAKNTKTVIASSLGVNLDDRGKKVIGDYLSAGGSAIFMVDGVVVGDDLSTQKTTHNLFSLFKQFGLSLEENLILSESSEIATFSTSRGVFLAPYPFWVKTTNFDKKRPEFANVQALTFPWTASVTINNEKDASVLVKSPPNSWAQKNNFTLFPESIPAPAKKDRQIFNMAVEKRLSGGGRLLLIPSSRFVADQFLSPRASNLEFIVNVVNNYASQGVLSGIRTRSLSAVPLKDVSSEQRDTVKYLTTFLLPGLFGFFGAVRILRRQTHGN